MEDVATVIFGDIVGSRRDPARSTAWLRALVAELDDAYADETIAPFAFTQGDELQGLLRRRADPFRAVLLATLRADVLAMRWAIVRGPIDPGEGPAIERTGQAFLAARAAIEGARVSRERLVVAVGDEATDGLLADLVPALAALLDGLTGRQRLVARLALVDGLRQSEVADRLNVSRATISISFSRAQVRPIERLLDAIRRVYRGDVVDVSGAAASMAPATAAGSGAPAGSAPSAGSATPAATAP